MNSAAIPGRPEIVRILLENGANPNVRDPSIGNDPLRRTPLHNILHHGNEEVATILIHHGADVTVQDTKGETPLHLAVKKSSVQVLEAMEDTGKLQLQHYQARNNEGNTPLDIAEKRQSSDRLQIIAFIQKHVQAAPAE